MQKLPGLSWRVLGAAAVMGLVAGLSSAGLLATIHAALDQSGRLVATIVFAFLGLCVLTLISSMLAELMLVRLGQTSVFLLRTQLSDRILSAPLRQLQDLGKHRLMAALTEDVNAIAGAFQILPIVLINAAIVLGCLVYLGWLAWQLLLTVSLVIVIGVISYEFLHRRAMRRLTQARNAEDGLYANFRGLLEGFRELKLNGVRRRDFLAQLRDSADTIREHYSNGMMGYVWANQWGNLLFFAVIGCLLFGLPGTSGYNAQTLTGYTLGLIYMASPLEAILHTLPTLSRGLVALKKIEALGLSLGKEPIEQESQPGSPKTSIHPGRLALRGVSHTYYHDQDDRHFALGPIDLVIEPGELVFVIGGNGSGKTTLAMLILGLYAPDRGEIYLGNERVSDSNREVYRQNFAAVFADAYVFDSLPSPESAEQDARATGLLGRLQLQHKVEVRNGRFSTTDLSQGQRKRLALLSAYIDDCPIYLFDEWAADQDPLFKGFFYTELLPELRAKGKTVIVITHDDHYFGFADRCVRLSDGMLDVGPTERDQHKLTAMAS